MYAQDNYQIKIDINHATEKSLPVTVNVPKIKENKARLVIPSIVPGTYMKVNYVRFYKDIKFLDENGNALSYRKRGKNVFEIRNADKLVSVSYKVLATTRDHKVWDNILACDGLILNPGKAYLLNAQLFAGYIEGYRDIPFEVIIEKPDSLYIGTSLKEVIHQQKFSAPNYDELVDNPILVTRPDTATFRVSNTLYKIVCYSDNGIITAKNLNPELVKSVTAIDSFFMHAVPAETYTFLFYFQDYKKLKGWFKSIGLGSALEHRHSSSYYLDDITDTTNLSAQISNSINYIVPHEMDHLFVPLHIRSKEVDSFDFKTPVMSHHVWMYEGFTEYFNKLICERYSLPAYSKLTNHTAFSMDVDKKRKKQVLTLSSKNIIKKNMFQFVGKILKLSNLYARGSMVAFFADIELFQQSNGALRLEDIIRKLGDKYDVGKPFDDATILDEISNMGYPGMRDFFSKYAESNAPLPYESLDSLFGWNIRPKGTPVNSFGSLRVKYSTDSSGIIVRKKMNNTLGLKKGDILYKKDDTLLTLKNIYPLFYQHFFNPKDKDSIHISVIRKGHEKLLSTSKMVRKKSKYSYITIPENASEEQKKRYDAFIHHRTF